MTAYTSTGEITFSFKHQHFAPPTKGPDGHPTKAFTFCMLIINGDGFVGTAWCSAADNFNKETGRKIALKKALDLAKLSREDRREVWMSYFARLVPTEYQYIVDVDGDMWVNHEAAI